ncbi:MAG: hypothetical protein IJT85_07095 [Ruminococcus sp.]|nr:hypothetical protein [Ruminococcus sp.]
MDEFKFDELKNFSVPESWLNKALEIPSKKPKAAPKFKFYRYAAAIAACVVIATAATLTVMFGFNNEINLTNPEPEKPANIIPTVETTVSETSGNTESLTEISTEKSSVEIRQSTTSIEPAENKADAFENGNSKKQIPKSTESKEITSESTTQSSIDEKTEPVTVPCVEGSTQTSSAPQGEKRCYVETSVTPELADGNIYCRLEDSDGNVIGNSGLYSESRLAKKQTGKNGTVILSYTFDNAKELDGKTLAVVFYNAKGEIIKKSMFVPFFENLYFMFK